MHISRPTVILVRPQMGENIGAAARAMMNFGLHDLRIVNPRDGWPNDKALSMAARAGGIIEKASVFDALEDACSDLHYLYATTARIRDLALQGTTPRAAANKIRDEAQHQYGILFGPENSGLSNHDLASVNQLIHIPTAPENPSLNLGQAVMIIAYEWLQAHSQAALTHPIKTAPPLATKEDITSICRYWTDAISNQSSTQNEAFYTRMQQLLTTASLQKPDADFMHGALRKLRETKITYLT